MTKKDAARHTFHQSGDNHLQKLEKRVAELEGFQDETQRLRSKVSCLEAVLKKIAEEGDRLDLKRALRDPGRDPMLTENCIFDEGELLMTDMELGPSLSLPSCPRSGVLVQMSVTNKTPNAPSN